MRTETRDGMRVEWDAGIEMDDGQLGVARTKRALRRGGEDIPHLRRLNNLIAAPRDHVAA